MMDFWSAIILHVIAAIPPTLAAVAALVTALRTKRDTQQIRIALNGRLDALIKRIADLEK